MEMYENKRSLQKTSGPIMNYVKHHETFRDKTESWNKFLESAISWSSKGRRPLV